VLEDHDIVLPSQDRDMILLLIIVWLGMREIAGRAIIAQCAAALDQRIGAAVLSRSLEEMGELVKLGAATRFRLGKACNCYSQSLILWGPAPKPPVLAALVECFLVLGTE
jgi:hypothetical protein